MILKSLFISNFKMRHFIINSIKYFGFFCLFCIGYYLCVAASTAVTPSIETRLITCAGNYGYNFKRTKDLDTWLNNNNEQPKGIVLGASTAYKNIDPHVLSTKTGINFFNAGSSSQCLVHSASILQYITEQTDIKYLIIESYPGIWEYSSAEGSMDWVVNNYKPQRSFVLDMVKHTNNIKLWNYWVYFSLKRSLPFTQDHLLCSPTQSIYKGDGFVYTPESIVRKNTTHESYSEMSDENKDALRKITAICKEKNISAVLLMAKVFNADIDNSSLQDFGIPIIDGNHFNIDSSYYYDSHHMYGRGTDSFSKWVAKEFRNSVE